MSRLKRFLIATLTLAAILAAILAGAAAFAPQVLINDSTMRLGLKVAKAFDVGVDWDEGHISVVSVSPLTKRLTLSLDGLEIDRKGISASLEKVRVAVTVSAGTPHLRDVGPIEIAGTNAKVAPSEPEADQGEPLNLRPLLDYLAAELRGPVHVAIERWTKERRDGSELNGLLDLTIERAPELGRRFDGVLVLDELTGLPLRRLEATGRIALAQDKLPASVAIELQALLEGDVAATFKLDATATAASHYRVRFDGSYDDRKGMKLKASGGGDADPRIVAGAWSLDVDAARRARVKLGDCRLDARSEDFLALVGTLRTSCKGALSGVPALRGLPLGVGDVEKVPFRVAADLRLERLALRHAASGTATLEVPELVRGAVRVGGKIAFDGTWPLGGSGEPRLTAHAEAGARIRNFRELVRVLHNTPTPVPAPLNQLAGTVTCDIVADLALFKEPYVLPLTCSTNLSSASQSVVIDVDAAVSVTPPSPGTATDVKLDADVNIENVQLVFPDLGPRSRLPRLTRDTRIDPKRKKPGGVRVEFAMRVKTLTPDAIRIINVPYTEGPAHLDLDLALASEAPMTGTIRLGSVGLEVLRRSAQVEYVSLTFDEDSARRGADLGGRVQVKSAEYVVYVELLGTLAKPRYILRSVPPLSEDEIIPLLLYGRTPDLLSDDEHRATADVKAAMSNRALGLASMYFLASTPIETVGYDPTTGVFSARVRLREGLALTVGSDRVETTSVGLRRRLSKSWSVETTAVTEKSTDHRRGIAMLRWARRY